MMTTYFNGGSEIQADSLQTLYLMNPSYAAGAYSDAQPPHGMLLLNPATAAPPNHALPPGSLPHAPNLPPHHQLVGIPLAPPASLSPGDDSGCPSIHEIPGSACGFHGLVPRLHYNLWGGGADSPSSDRHQTQIPTAIAFTGGGELGSPMGFRRMPPVASLDHHHQQQQQQQGLSLSLNNSSPHKHGAVLSPESGSPASASGVTNGVAGVGPPSLIMGSKYLKAAQQLLDEVVNVGKAISMADSGADVAKEKAKGAVVAAGEGQSGGGGESSGGKRVGAAADLTTALRQELQMKKAKLLSMLDEVEQRYRQYHSQMQAVAASFEQVAGPGSARSYTALALQTISRQFRCLKDAIASQVRATARSLGEDDEGGAGGKGEGSRSRLRFVDYQLRQQRVLQQLGMMQHNAWRPQRGLPERAVSVLRAWLFEHFLHPYPKDSDKHVLAKQTGLTRSQVSNWFINARVRLWKPMVEEMYLEEMKAQEQNNSEDQTNKLNNDHNKDSTLTSKSPAGQHPHINQNPQAPPPTTDITTTNTTVLTPSPSSTPATLNGVGTLQGFSLIRPTEIESMIQRSPKRQRSSDMQNSPSSILSMDMEMKPGAGNPNRELFTGFGAYPVGDIGSRFNPDHQQLGHQQRYHHGNAVSLTLSLPHHENLSLSGNHHGQHLHNFIPGDFSGGGAGASGYEGMDMQSRKRFAAQLLPDFVA